MRPVPIEQFPGLDLRSDPGETRGAIDLANVTIEPGRIRSRDGTSLLATLSGQIVFLDRAMRPDGTEHLISALAGSPATVRASTSAGVSIAETTLASMGNAGASGVAIGTPSATYFYVTSGGPAPDGTKRWDGATWVSASALPGGISALGKTAVDNRMILVTDQTRVKFSDPGAPETLGANNYVDLHPGDGESVTALANFNNQTFAFKRTKFYVFYGQSTDGTGEPIFNYRTFDNGIGVQSSAPQSVCVGLDGVYFIGPDGVYRTSGGPAVCISRVLDPFFDGTTDAYWAGGEWDPTSLLQRLAWFDGRLYAALATGGNDGVIMVWDPQLDAWTMWSRRVGALGPLLISSLAQVRLILGSTTLQRVDPGSVASDAGTTFASRYRSGFTDFGEPRQKMLRETIVEGYGTPTLRWSRDWGALTAGSAVTLGQSTVVVAGRQSKALPGRMFSFQVGAASSMWSVNRLQANLLMSARPVSVTT